MVRGCGLRAAAETPRSSACKLRRRLVNLEVLTKCGGTFVTCRLNPARYKRAATFCYGFFRNHLFITFNFVSQSTYRSGQASMGRPCLFIPKPWPPFLYRCNSAGLCCLPCPVHRLAQGREFQRVILRDHEEERGRILVDLVAGFRDGVCPVDGRGERRPRLVVAPESTRRSQSCRPPRTRGCRPVWGRCRTP